MKKALQLLSFWIWFSSSLNAQDGGQKILVWQNGSLLGAFDQNGGNVASGNPTFTYTVTDDSVTVPNLPCPGNPCGWYKGFWILGDGNYKKYPDDNANLDAASKTLENYTYAKSGTYNPVVYLTEKYTNHHPPPGGDYTLQLTIGAPTQGVEITKRLAASPTRKIDIDYMHGLRKGYPTPLVLSYRKTEPATKVLLFYNSLKTGPTISDLTASALMDYQLTKLPDYFFSNAETAVYSDLTNPKGNYIATYGASVLARLQSKFKNCLSYKVDNPATVPSGFEELRVFPVIKTKELEDLPGGVIPSDSAVFVSFLLGNQALSTSDPAYSTVYSTALSVLGSPLSANMALSGSEFIRGIAIQNFKIGTSHDPNHLKVSRITDLGNQTYRVFFELRICNHSETPETRPNLEFKDLTNGHFGMKPCFLGLKDKVSVSWSAGLPWAVTLDGYQISGAPAGFESCNDLEFYIDTDQAGAELLKNQGKALEVCVKFSAGEGDCSDNDPFIEKADSGIADLSTPWVWISLYTLLAFAGILLFAGKFLKKMA